MDKFLFAAGSLDDAIISRELSLRSQNFYTTIGIHPCRALEPYKSLLPTDQTTVDGTIIDSGLRQEKLEAYIK